MSRRDINNFPILTAKSLASNFTSPVTVPINQDNLSYVIVVTTVDSTGTFTLQASNDYRIIGPNNVVINAGNWVDLPLSGNPTVAATNDVIGIDVNQPSFSAFRLSYTSTIAGTGTCDIQMNNKPVGG